MNSFLNLLGSSTEIFVFLGLSFVLSILFLPKNIKGLDKKKSLLVPVILVQTFILFIVLIFLLGTSVMFYENMYTTIFFISFFLTVLFNTHFFVVLSSKGKNVKVQDAIKESIFSLSSVFVPILIILSCLYVFIGGVVSILIFIIVLLVLVNFLVLGFLTPAILNLLESI